MMTQKIRQKNARKAISPAIATVMLIAITLIAGVAIGGYIFGLFGTQTATAQVSSSSATLVAGTAASGGTSATAFYYYCAAPATQTGQLDFINGGVSSARITGISLTYGGVTYTNSSIPTTMACSTVASAGSATIYMQGRPVTVSGGALFVGEAILSNGARVSFTGSWR